MSIQITNNGANILIVNNGSQTYLSKDNLMIRELANEDFGLYKGEFAVFRGNFNDVTVPVVADVQALCSEIGTYICDCTTANATLTDLLTELELIGDDIGKTYYQRIYQNDFPSTFPGFSGSRKKPLSVSTEEVIWMYPSATYPFPTVPAFLSIVSDNANDDGIAPLSGMRICVIVGLNAAGNLIFDSVTMNGLTPVVTTQKFFRVLNAFPASAGSSRVNEGNITITHLGNVVSYMVAGDGWESKAVGTVPTNYTMFLDCIASVTELSGTSNVPVTFRVYTRNINDGITQKPFEFSTKGTYTFTEFAVASFNDVYITAQMDFATNVNVEVLLKSVLYPNS